MKTRRFLVLLALALVPTGPVAAADDSPAAAGRGLYMRHCAPCHGQSGKGDGPNAELFLSKPRDLTDGVLDRYTTDALVKRVLDGSRLPLGLDVAALRRHSDEVGAIERHVRKFPQLDWVAVENGWAIFAERCAVCHGPFGEPRAALPDGVKAPGNLQSEAFQSSVTDAQLMDAVRHGRKGMPALVPRLREDEAANVAAFVRVLSPGFQSYSMFCGQCHGDDGVGVGNYDETVAAPAVAFDAEYFEEVSPDHFRESVWHMLRDEKPSMPHFRGQLSEANVRAIIEYLRSVTKKKVPPQ